MPRAPPGGARGTHPRGRAGQGGGRLAGRGGGGPMRTAAIGLLLALPGLAPPGEDGGGGGKGKKEAPGGGVRGGGEGGAGPGGVPGVRVVVVDSRDLEEGETAAA